MSKYKIQDGSAQFLGANLTELGCNFAVHCPHADGLELVLFDSKTEQQIQVISVPAKTGKVWHCFVEGIKAGQLYAYRVLGKNHAHLGVIFDYDKLLIDPYAKSLNRPLIWNAEQYQGDSQSMVPKALVLDNRTSNPRPAKPNLELDQTILYEAHVKGLTQLHPDVPDEIKGKFLGICHPKVLQHLQELGVTAIQLMPVAAFMPEPFITNKGLTNYWGYNPINYFCPDPRYIVKDGVNEFKTMVDCLHEAGIEVILDVVFNHTAEGGLDGPILSFKGFDNSSFYLFERNEYGAVDYDKYVNNSGCGNSVNTAFPYVLKMVMDALRYWVTDMGVDGFRFDLAASLGRDPYEFSSLSGFFRTIRQDPVLINTKLIAEPWDIGHGGYRLGQFPSNWLECNDKYRDTVRAFWRGDKGLTSDFATRLLGSRDVFSHENRSILTSVNNISYHDGFTLHDLVSYAERHNEANGEQNRDGHGHNLSANYGMEGVTTDKQVLALRERQKRNLFATLLLSQGTPHVLGGDELSRTQQGNNNAYCQDNEISWLDWNIDETKQDFLTFCQQVIKLRKSSEILHHLNLADDQFSIKNNVEKIYWYRPDGERKLEDDWHDHNNQAFALELRSPVKGEENHQEHWLLVINASDHDVCFQLPNFCESDGWRLKLDTRYAKYSQQPDVVIKNKHLQAYRSISVFECAPLFAPGTN
ncbi:glycogen debranching protein GlgX [Paraglaciecola aquimarina]|uniref:Glycogen debranching protein GlgX n=1 Tax=Paraglaciecola algarum TaxID=3050085 RepID=A0ABS9D2K1_9ALTE|nr:glycogen debranching protein GlgX [Paraglaciecola sp. G1-23]